MVSSIIIFYASGAPVSICGAALWVSGAVLRVCGAALWVCGAAMRVSGAVLRVSGAPVSIWGAVLRVCGAPVSIWGVHPGRASGRAFGASGRLTRMAYPDYRLTRSPRCGSAVFLLWILSRNRPWSQRILGTGL